MNQLAEAISQFWRLRRVRAAVNESTVNLITFFTQLWNYRPPFSVRLHCARFMKTVEPVNKVTCTPKSIIGCRLDCALFRVSCALSKLEPHTIHCDLHVACVRYLVAAPKPVSMPYKLLTKPYSVCESACSHGELAEQLEAIVTTVDFRTLRLRYTAFQWLP